jgi:hypothetical protein
MSRPGLITNIVSMLSAPARTHPPMREEVERQTPRKQPRPIRCQKPVVGSRHRRPGLARVDRAGLSAPSRPPSPHGSDGPTWPPRAPSGAAPTSSKPAPTPTASPTPEPNAPQPDLTRRRARAVRQRGVRFPQGYVHCTASTVAMAAELEEVVADGVEALAARQVCRGRRRGCRGGRGPPGAVHHGDGGRWGRPRAAGYRRRGCRRDGGAAMNDRRFGHGLAHCGGLWGWSSAHSVLLRRRLDRARRDPG